MEAQHGHSSSCCNIPPVVSSDYKPKGRYETVGETKMYVTGPATATKAIFFVFDIFGYFDQTVQGADILAYADKDHQYLVFVPDFFDGKPADIAWMPPDTEEKQQALGGFFQSQGAPPTAVGKVPGLVKAISAQYPHIGTWGGLGFCWGGKVISVTGSMDASLFSAGAQCHPAMVDPAEAPGIKIPMLLIASGDEEVETVKAFEDGLAVPKQVVRFDDQIHGFMGARGDLDNPRVKAEYERGYKVVLDFFSKHL